MRRRAREAGAVNRLAKVALVLGAVAAVALYATSPWKAKPEPGSRAWQVQEFRADRKACGKFASKREEARELLAWKPEPPWVNPPGTAGWKKEWEDRQTALREANRRSLNADLKELSARLQADAVACLRHLDWPDVQIESLQKEIAEADAHRAHSR
jgi:hypothetical protein